MPHEPAPAKAGEFTVTLTDEQAGEARELAAWWNVTLDEAVRRAAVEGLNIAMMEKANDEHHAMPRKIGPSGDLDDDIPF
jgi:hypothetical protein